MGKTAQELTADEVVKIYDEKNASMNAAEAAAKQRDAKAKKANPQRDTKRLMYKTAQ